MYSETEIQDKIFADCEKINFLLESDQEKQGREGLIKLLDFHSCNNIAYSPLVNHLIREVGLYPYMEDSNLVWQDAFVKSLFRADVGASTEVTLHREQYLLLKKLLDGKNIAVSAPTSFGKSFVVDAFIRMKQPRNVMIIVPTIALTDETRRRIYKKFAREYNVITAPDEALGEKNIFIFPQERALGYVNKVQELDILIVDEFYKSSLKFEPDRSPSLVKAIIKLGNKARQKYYLAPNISDIEENPFTSEMEFLPLDFNTVFLEKHDLYKEIGTDSEKKGEALVRLCRENKGKTLIYAGTFTKIAEVSNLLLANIPEQNSALLNDFASWIGKNYDYNWNLTLLAKRGVGVHNGKLHRSLSQLQVHLFEEENGLNQIISTSSIIEGVNTSAENVIVWMVNAKPKKFSLNNFSYKNVIGRAGRMFKHFIGKIYLLDTPPADEDTQLSIPFPDSILGDLDKNECKGILTEAQASSIAEYDSEMSSLMGSDEYKEIKESSSLKTSDSNVIKAIAGDMKHNPQNWVKLGYLNQEDPNAWIPSLFMLVKLISGLNTSYTSAVKFIGILKNNWSKTVPELLVELEPYEIDLDKFFELERVVTFKLSALLSDINTLQSKILDNRYNISSFVYRLSHAFLPPVVYQLEEYGLPRMISRKIQESGLMDFENAE